MGRVVVTPLRIAVRGLRHYAGSAAATASGVAVAACVVAGSLIAGESVTATLRQSALSRIGKADFAVVGSRPFRMRTARAMSTAPGVVASAPILIRSASVQNADTGAVAARAQLIGAGAAFFGLVPQPGTKRLDLRGREAAISRALASDLGLKVGDAIVVRPTVSGQTPTTSIFARRSLSDATRALRLEVTRILPQDGPGGFGLGFESGARRNVIADAEWLAERLELDGEVDAQLLSVLPGTEPAGLVQALRRSASPQDLGLSVEADRQDPGSGRTAVIVRSADVTLTREQADALAGLGTYGSVRSDFGSMMLATTIGDRNRSAHYAVVAHSPDVAVGDGSIVLNAWLAEDLGARIGRRIAVEWLRPMPDGSYPSRNMELTVSGIVPIEVAVRQRWLTPSFEGITDAERMSDWDPPFPVDLSRITSRDEQYWDQYRAAPKAFVSRGVIRRMWGVGDDSEGADRTADEWVTAVRFLSADAASPNRLPSASGASAPNADEPGREDRGSAEAGSDLADRVRDLMRTDERLWSHGPSVRSVRSEALAASQGSSDFRGLMLGMSMFIVASGISLSAMLLRMSAERRASQIGLLLAVGFRQSSAAAFTALEGGLAALGGAVVGGALGAPFAALLVRALNSWWSGAVAGEPIGLHIGWAGPAVGALSAFALGTIASWMAARRMARSEALLLMAGWRAVSAPRRARGSGRAAALASVVMLSIAAVLLVSRGGGVASESVAALIGGALILTSGLTILGAKLADPRLIGSRPDALSIRRIAHRNAALRRGQSVLVAGVIAGASFLMVVVAANVRSGTSVNVRDRRSGAGGFDLIARTSAPLAIGFDTPQGRANLGFDEADEGVMRDIEVVPFLVSPGVDASCLNLARPTAPRVLGVPRAMVERGGFSVRTAQRLANPWSLLEAPIRRGEVAAFGDAESVRWILQSRLGGKLARDTSAGRFTLRFDGLVPFSIFAGEVLVSESSFRAMFPGIDAPAYFLIRTGEGKANAVADALRRNLGEAGMEVRLTREVLDELMGVQNTYLAAFLVLGGLGLALGVLGIGAVLLRSAHERRSELGILAAMGITRARLASLMLAESAALLVYGAMLGVAAGLAAAAPRIASGDTSVNWAAPIVAVAAILTSGLLSCLIAAWRGTAGTVVRAIRSE